jgi:hypothetical protein
MNGEHLKSFSGHICLFLDDGSYISADDQAIRRISATSKKIWEIKGNYHHQLNLSYDKQKILALGSSIFRKDERQDKFQIIALDGKILFEKNFSEYFSQTANFGLSLPMSKLTFIDDVGLTKEFSHFNSFYEIPDLPASQKRPSWMRLGNYIVNGLVHGYFILSPDLKEILYKAKFDNSPGHHVHDVQVTKRGTILYYNNLVKENSKNLKNILGGEEPELRYSGIYEVVPLTHKILRKFESNPKQMFFAWISGGVQELDDSTWIFNHFLSGTYIYDHNKKKMLNSFATTNADFYQHLKIQQVNSADLSKFLKYWK